MNKSLAIIRKRKSLGQIGYEADERGGIQNWGEWDKLKRDSVIGPLITGIHEKMARNIAFVVIKRLGVKGWKVRVDATGCDVYKSRSVRR